jgi:hypothetical protein
LPEKGTEVAEGKIMIDPTLCGGTEQKGAGIFVTI